MTTTIFAFSDKGCTLAKLIAKQYSDASCFALPKFAQKHNIFPEENTQQRVGEVFDKTHLLVFVGAVGIAVRMIAPYIKSKTTDPAVLVVDECCSFVIPLLSGHIGGANGMARTLAHGIGATAVITTATDINDKFSVDEWAAKNGLYISDMQKAKEISATILEREVSIKSDFPIDSTLPNGITFADAPIAFEVTYKNYNNGNLHLVPKVLSIGIGSKKDVSPQRVEDLFLKIIEENSLDINAIKVIASIDIKKEEKAIITLSKKYHIPFITYTGAELSKLEGDFTPSDFVKATTGTDNVCERSAVMANGGELIVKKTAFNGVTIAIAKENWKVEF